MRVVEQGRKASATWTLRLLGGLLGVLVPAPLLAVDQWVRWEVPTALTSIASPANQDFYRNVRLRVTFERKSGSTVLEKFDALAFWVGSKDFKFRAAFPTAGTWSWRTNCEAGCTDSAESGGLVKTGSVVVTAYGGANVLYKSGLLKVKPGTAADRGLLTFNNGTLFNWVGDTVWSGPVDATAAQWSEYLKTHAKSRQKMKYTVIQIAYPIDWMQQDGVQPTFPGMPNLKPFKAANCAESGSIPRAGCLPEPAFWDEYDRRIQEANDAGFVVCLIGLMERILESRPWPPTVESQHLARYVTSRLAGNFVVYSPGFDRMRSDQTARINAVGTEAAAASRTYATPTATPKARQLIGLHLAASDVAGDYTSFKTQTWLSFYLMQSGQALNLAYQDACGNLSTCACYTASTTNEKKVRDKQLERITDRARLMVGEIRTNDAAKPVVNAEAIYESSDLAAPCKLCISRLCNKDLQCPGCTQQSGSCIASCPAAPYAENYSPLRVRQTGYYSLLNGAAGYTVGAGGLFDWTSYANGLNRAASSSMKQLATLHANVTWSVLKPAPDRLASAGSGANLRVAAANADTVVVYSPTNAAVQIKTAGLTNWPGGWSKQWFSPSASRNPEFSDVAQNERSCAASTCSFTPSGAGDWVLVLKKVQQSQAGTILQAWASTLGEEERPVVLAQLVDDKGELVGEAVEVSDSLAWAEKSDPRVAQDLNGNYLVVWEEGPGEKGPQLSGRRLDADGNPKGGPLVLGASEVGPLVEAAVTPVAGGGFMVAWASRGEESQVFARAIDAHGNLQTPVTVATAVPGNTLVNPEVAADSDGNFLVAWREVTPPPEEEVIEVGAEINLQRFTAGGSPVEAGIGVTVYSSSVVEIDSLSLGDSGEISLSYDTWNEQGELAGVYEVPIDTTGEVGEVLAVWEAAPPGSGLPEE